MHHSANPNPSHRQRLAGFSPSAFAGTRNQKQGGCADRASSGAPAAGCWQVAERNVGTGLPRSRSLERRRGERLALASRCCFAPLCPSHS
eukprot:scaffold26009_cov129-Isochrysis_galbana.AAC.3